MDLYGDLPPASGDETISKTAVGGWSQSQNSMRPRQIVEEIKPPAANVMKVPTKPVSMLAFKPRQTASGAIKLAGLAAPAISVDPAPSTNFNLSTTSKESVPCPKQSPAQSSNVFVPSSPNSFARNKENEEFNDNHSFDVEDAYDPRKPNDYLLYCEERLEIKKIKKLQEQNAKNLLEQEKQREEQAKLRQQAVESGDYSALLNLSVMANSASNNQNKSASGGFTGFSSKFSDGPGGSDNSAPPTRGRGRGLLNNLPAWMTKQMESNGLLSTAAGGGASTAATATSSTTDSVSTAPNTSAPVSPGLSSTGDRSSGAVSSSGKEGQFIDSTPTATVPAAKPSAALSSVIGMKRKQGNFSKPSCVVLLKNMVSPDDVDDMLTVETKQECEKYGSVNKCVIYEVPAKDAITGIRCPDEERVRLYVLFEKQESAVKAYRDLSGRFFGGRQITASFYDEDKFSAGDLAPSLGEW